MTDVTDNIEAHGIQVTVDAGEHDRYDSLVTFAIPANDLDLNDQSVVAVDPHGMTYPIQSESHEDGHIHLSWIVPRMRKRSIYSFTLVAASKSDVPSSPSSGVDGALDLRNYSGVRFIDRNGSVDVYIGDEHFTSYQYDSNWVRPFLYPVVGPGGGHVTRHFPMRADVPGERHDHPHHKSIYFAHGDVNGVNIWSESEGHGYTRHQRFTELKDGPVYGTLQSENVWTDGDDNPITDQRLTLRFYALPTDTRLIDATLTFKARYGDVVFGDTKEGGLLSVRVASSMDASGSGRIQLATGAVGERESWGKSAPWCHYSGLVKAPNGPVHSGIGLIDHPSNPRYPTYWHVRNYGLMTANPFGHADFYRDKSRDGSLRLPAGQTMTFRYRIVIHPGDAQQGVMHARFADFAYPPVVKT